MPSYSIPPRGRRLGGRQTPHAQMRARNHRRTRSGRTVHTTPPEADVEDLNPAGRDNNVLDVDQMTDEPACIDLTEMDDTAEMIDLTSTNAIENNAERDDLSESPIVIMSTSSGTGRRSTRGSTIELDDDDSLSSDGLPVFDLPGLPDLPDLANSGGDTMTSPGPSTAPDADTPGRVVTCPVCMDNAREIRSSKRTLMSTNCGHVFCSDCINGAIMAQKKCPSCRKKLTKSQVHPLYL